MSKSENFWDKRAEDYDRQNKKYELSNNKAVEYSIKYFEKNNTVLDYGCAYGLITVEIAKYVKEAHGIDISQKMIEIAKRKAQENKIENVKYSHSTIFDDILKEDSFDVILAYNVLHLVDDLQKVAIRINELLKPGGFFISETVCLGEKKSAISFFLGFLSKIKLIPNVRKLKFSDLETLIVNSNFEIIETEDFKKDFQNYFIVAKKL